MFIIKVYVFPLQQAQFRTIENHYLEFNCSRINGFNADTHAFISKKLIHCPRLRR
ncbi:hypothetical protein SynPROS71_01502 [Synechococcus sp. PROS-7-1]|nr:hypothetical protein SynPROS71_01502 [Synechococcus sp. PROS-7-1]